MRRRITWRSAAAISMLGLTPGIGAAFAGPAGASTYTCAAAYGTQCGTFTASAATKAGEHSPNIEKPPPSDEGGGLGWDVKGASSAFNTPLIEGPNHSPGNYPGTDLTKVEHWGQIPGSPYHAALGYWYSFVYTPSGQWTSMCVANPVDPRRDGTNLVLRPCNGLKWQAFLAIPPTGGHHDTLNFGGGQLFLPPAPHWWAPTSSVPIPNLSSTSAYALYSMANGRFVEVTRPHMSDAAINPGPGPQPRALSATGDTGDRLNPPGTTNTWFWTNANGTGPSRGR